MTLFSFRKENNMRVLLTLEQWDDGNPDASKRTNDVIAVREAVREYVRWIVKNGFKETVAGFELGNETYFDPRAEEIAARWRVIIPAILDEWPDAKIGIPLAEYADNDPDLKALRNRDYLMLLVVNSRTSEAVADVDLKGYSLSSDPTLREVRFGKDGESVVRDCREERRPTPFTLAVGPKTFQTVPIPIRKRR